MNQKAIHEAARVVLEKRNAPMSAKEIYDQIVLENLYEFNAKDPVSVVRSPLRRPSINTNMKASSSHRCFRVASNGTFEIASD